jgi:hypothetical protein
MLRKIFPSWRCGLQTLQDVYDSQIPRLHLKSVALYVRSSLTDMSKSKEQSEERKKEKFLKNQA